MVEDLKLLIDEKENIMYEGKPNKKCFIFEAIFNPLLPFALIWLIFDGMFIGIASFSGDITKLAFFLIPFFLLHLMPVWLYLGGIIFTVKRYKNTYYIVTDRAVYISGGVISKHIQNKPFAELSHVDLHRGFFDQKFGVGDIVLTSAQRTTGDTTASLAINSISEYQEVYKMVKKLQTDIYTDVMYPNDKRPSENHGYNTEYKG